MDDDPFADQPDPAPKKCPAGNAGSVLDVARTAVEGYTDEQLAERLGDWNAVRLDALETRRHDDSSLRRLGGRLFVLVLMVLAIGGPTIGQKIGGGSRSAIGLNAIDDAKPDSFRAVATVFDYAKATTLCVTRAAIDR